MDSEPVQPDSVNGHTLASDSRYGIAMDAALSAAKDAAAAGDVPVGATVIRLGADGTAMETVAIRSNERELTGDPTAHAEVLALREAARHLERWRLEDCVLVVTLEPCPMCAGAAWASRIGGVVFGATNDDAGALGTLYNLGQDPRLNHEFPVLGGVRSTECAEVMREFFDRKR